MRTDAGVTCGIHLLAISILAFLVTPAGAITLGVEAFGAFDTHAMTFWNTDLDVANAAGGRFHHLNVDVTGGLGARVWISRPWRVHADWEPLRLESRDAATGRRLNFDAGSLQLGAAYFFPTARALRLGLSAGLGYYSLHGLRASSGVKTAGLSGTTTGMQFQGLFEWPAQRWVALNGSVGYRMARIADTKVDGRSLAPRVETDYSGLIMRIGIAFYLPSRSREVVAG